MFLMAQIVVAVARNRSGRTAPMLGCHSQPQKGSKWCRCRVQNWSGETSVGVGNEAGDAGTID